MKNLDKKILLTILLLTISLITISSVNAAKNNTDLGDLITEKLNNSVINLEKGICTNNTTNILIDKNITITEKGSNKTLIDAKINGQIFNIAIKRTKTLINLTIINEYINANGGAIYNSVN